MNNANSAKRNEILPIAPEGRERREPGQSLHRIHGAADQVRSAAQNILAIERKPMVEVRRTLEEKAQAIRESMSLLKRQLTHQQWLSFFNQISMGMLSAGTFASHGYVKTVEQPGAQHLMQQLQDFVTYAESQGVPSDDLLSKTNLSQPGANVFTTLLIPLARTFHRRKVKKQIGSMEDDIIGEVLHRVDLIARSSRGPQESLAA